MEYLEKYNPSTSIFSQFIVDENLPIVDRAFQTWKALLTAKRSHDGLFIVIGMLLKSVRDNKLYEKLDYENFSQFLADEKLGFSREKAYLCIKTYEYYIEYLEMDPEKVREMNISRLALMVPILKKIEDKEEVIRKIESYNSLRHSDFLKEIKQKTNRDGKPNVFWSEEQEKWIVQYYDNTTLLQSIGEFNVQ